MSNFSYALVRPPAPNFADGLTTQTLGLPDYVLALKQHETYCHLLEQCGLTLISLPAEIRYPDSTFVEDAAILTPRCAIFTRPGASSRLGEVEILMPVLEPYFARRFTIAPPGTLDGGDVCEAEGKFFIGISARTNAEGARQLKTLLEMHGYPSTLVDIRQTPGILHLKSGIASLGGGCLALIDAFIGHEAFDGYELVPVPQDEQYAANCILVNGRLIAAAGFPKFHYILENLGYAVSPLDMSEFQKMDGGLSCLSLRF